MTNLFRSKRFYTAALFFLCSASFPASSQGRLSVHWEELTGPDFVQAIKQAHGVCILPFGIMEKHGPHMPIGTDLYTSRYASEHAAMQTYAVVFPPYYFGQIGEARHEPGTLSYPRELQIAMLQATTDEMSRNGCKKILVVNGHGGNTSLLPYFAQTQMEKPHDYAVYIFNQRTPTSGGPKRTTVNDQHAGESETSKMMIMHPELLHLDKATSESGDDKAREHLPEGVYTGSWWFARFPDHYAGVGSAGNKALGEYQTKWWIDQVVQAINAIKADNDTLRIQNEFYEKMTHPVDTPQ